MSWQGGKGDEKGEGNESSAKDGQLFVERAFAPTEQS